MASYEDDLDLAHIGVWSYEGDKHGRHDVSICIGEMTAESAHECYATAHGKTEAEAIARAKRIVAALKAEGTR